MVYTPDADDERYYHALEKLLDSRKGEQERLEAAVNAPFHNPVQATSLDLGIIVLLFVNSVTDTIDRIALSDTEQAKGAVRMSEKPFASIKIPVGHKSNIIAQAIATGRPHHTSDWQYLFTPALTPQAARFNQAGAGVECSHVYPLVGVGKGAAMIFSYYQPAHNIGSRHRHFMQFYAGRVAEYLGRGGQP